LTGGIFCSLFLLGDLLDSREEACPRLFWIIIPSRAFSSFVGDVELPRIY